MNISYGESLLQVFNAIVNVFLAALEKYFDFTIRGIANKTGQFVSPGYTVGGKTKADALDLAAEKYMFSDICHCFFLIGKYNINRLFWQSHKSCRSSGGKIVINNISVIYVKLFKNGYNNTTFNYLNL